jgi:hypothetical protein
MSHPVERQCDIGGIVNRLTSCGYHVGLQTYEGGIRVWMCDRLYSHCVEHFAPLPPNPGLRAIERRTAEAAVWLLEQALHEFGGSDDILLRSVVVPLRIERSRSSRARQEGQARVEKMKAWNREP